MGSMTLLGAGVASASFTPLSLSPALWLKADAGLYQETSSPSTLSSADGDPVGTWQDQSGNARHASAATSAKRPTLKLAIQNGMPAILWDGADDQLLTSAFQAFPSKRGSLFVVWKQTAASGKCFVIGTYGAAAIAWIFATDRSGFGHKWYDGAGWNYESSPTDDVWTIQGAIRTADTTLLQRKNGSTKSTFTITNNQPGSEAITIGCDTSGGYRFGGYIGEILLFDTALSDSDRLLVENYLNNRWGIYNYSTPVAGEYPELWLKADAGVVSDGAAQFTAASSQGMSIASNSTLQTGDIDYWGACWIYKDSNVQSWLMAKGASAGGWEYALTTSNTGDICFNPMTAGGSGMGGAGWWGSALSTGAWHFVMFYYDSVNNTDGLSVDGSAFTSGPTGSTCTAGTGRFVLSDYGDAGTPGYFHNGRMDSACFGKNPAGGIASLKNAIRDALYNSGSGVRYSSLTTQQKSDWGLVSFWDFAAGGATLVADSHGSNTLTNNNGVTFAAGVVSGSAVNTGDAVATWQDQSGHSVNFTAATAAVRPTYTLSVKNGMPALSFDGVDDYLAATIATIAQPYTVVIVGKATGATNQYYFDCNNSSPVVTNAAGSQTSVRMYAGGSLVDKTGLASDAWRMIVASFNGANSELYVNDLSAVTGSAGTDATGTAIRLGRWNTGATYYLNGYLGEVLVFRSALSSTFRASLQAYLNTRWGVY